MKDVGMIFSAPMVRAILQGRKTQTRRIVKLPEWANPDRGQVEEHGMLVVISEDSTHCKAIRNSIRPGDTIWVRETWGIGGDGYEIDPTLNFKADKFQRPLDPTLNRMRPEVERVFGRGWRSPIHMPRWASRLSLPVKAVRLERLQEMSEEDAQAEGFSATSSEGSDIGPGEFTAKLAFAMFWDKLHGPGGWHGNPWVWVYEWEPIR